jgi:hypothetical protein
MLVQHHPKPNNFNKMNNFLIIADSGGSPRSRIFGWSGHLRFQYLLEAPRPVGPIQCGTACFQRLPLTGPAYDFVQYSR